MQHAVLSPFHIQFQNAMTTEEKEKLDAYLKGIVLNLPDSPGCYQYLNDEGGNHLCG